MFRVMTPTDDNRPAVGSSARLLGVRVPPAQHVDIEPTSDGMVSPGTSGMSVSPSFATLPPLRVPERLRAHYRGARGRDEDRVFTMGEGAFEAARVTERLDLLPDRPGHGVVRPARVMSLDAYQAALADTAPDWRIEEP